MSLSQPAFRRRRLSLPPLIDVIFLLLLFFMLSSTFSHFGEIELTQSASGARDQERARWFVQLGPDRMTLNGQPVGLVTLVERIQEGRVLISLEDVTDAQRLVDVLAALRSAPELTVTVLE